MSRKNISLFFCTLFIVIMTPRLLIADSTSISVDCGNEIGPINKKVFGNNIIAYDPTTYEDRTKPYYGYSVYGAGIWDPKWNSNVADVVNLAKNVGVSVLRFPGGCGTHHYDWKTAIGKDREHFLYGIDEFLRTCKEVGAEPVITVSYFTGDEKDAADLVEYLNAIDDGQHKWAMERARNGRKEPYGVRYFEIGNEDYHGDHKDVKRVLPDEYARRYLLYYESMKNVDSSIFIGAVLWTPEWNAVVLETIKGMIDFGIAHFYPYPDVSIDELTRMEPDTIYKITLGRSILNVERDLHNMLLLLKQKSGRNLPLAITEYNGGFVQDKPVPYRHCLGTSLVNAELFRLFMKPENNILIANYWNFNNSYTGMISNGFNGNAVDLYKPYFKRPNYYVYEMYHNHFGDLLVKSDVKCDSYEIKGKQIPYLSVNTSKRSDGSKVYIMVINKSIDTSVISTIVLNDFAPATIGHAWVLNGPSIDATNEQKENNVTVKERDFEINANPFTFTFEPHSLTAIEIEKE